MTAEAQQAQHFVIVGAGECGARAAFALRENGFDGDITLIGSESHPPYERPPLSKSALLAEPQTKSVASADLYAESRIALLTDTTVDAIDTENRKVLLSDGKAIQWDRLLISTGATPRKLPGVSPVSERILTLRTFGDAMKIRAGLGEGKSLIIVGGGFIGLELAATARKSGTRVTVIETQPRVLMRGVPEEVALTISNRHLAEGVDLLCGKAIASLTESNDGVAVELADGRKIEADLAIVGIGAMPITALAEKAGIALDNGIAVNDRLETSVPGIFAAGDCCSFPLEIYGGRRVRLESWRNTHDQGNLVAKNMMGADQPISAVPWFWSDQYDLTLQVAGLSNDAVTHVKRQIRDGDFIIFHLDGEGRLLAASGIGLGNAVAKDIRIAEMIIAAGGHPDPAALADPEIKMKSLLAR